MNAPNHSTTNDAALIALGAALAETQAALAAFRRKRPDATEEDREPLALRRDELLDAIEAAPAASLEGLKVKARALKAIYSDCSVFDVGDALTTDMRLASRIAEGLSRPRLFRPDRRQISIGA